MDPTPLSLLEQMKSGDKLAWEHFHELYGRRIWAKVNEVLGRVRPGADWTQDDHQFAADVCQEVVLKVFLKLPTFVRARDGSFRVWLDTLARNHTLTELRKPRNRPADWSQERIDNVIAQLEDPREGFHVMTEEEHRHCLIAKALNEMKSDHDDDMIELFKRLMIRETTAEEVARQLSISVAAVHLRKHRFVKKLREQVNRYLRDLEE